MSFRYRSHQIQEAVRAEKVVREGQNLEFKNFKDRGKALVVDLDVKDGALLNLQLRVTAGRFDEPETYRAALLLDGHRIRGVDYAELETRRFYQVVVPRGWHENIIDPNLPTREGNRHAPLSDFSPMDLNDFLGKIAAVWHIELGLDRMLL